MKVAVKDACVLIDLANGGLLEAWFHLGIETFTTDLVIRQVRVEEQWRAVSEFVEAGLLRVETLSGEQIERMGQTLGEMRIGFEDQSALFLAIERDAILLTGDRRLRIEAGKKNVDVRGLLWILDELVSQSVIAPSLAIVKLQTMRDSGARLPANECEVRVRAWSTALPAN